MTIYQLYVSGSSSAFSGKFKCASKSVYKHYPTDEEKKKFVDTCAEMDGHLDWLNTEEDYEVIVHELELVD